MHGQLKGSLALLTASILWGFAFAAQEGAMKIIGPFTFVFMRSIITSVFLFAIHPLFSRQHKPRLKEHLGPGALMGVVLFTAMSLQQYGLVTTTAAKSGFITTLYVLMVPLVGLFLGRRPGLFVWIGMALAVAGLYLLCINDSFTLQGGDVFSLLCALAFTMHIIVIARLSDGRDAMLLSAIQFGTCALLGLIATLLFEQPSYSGIASCIVEILYAAICSGAIAYTLQIFGQRYTEPTLASLLMCLESFFAAVGGWVVLGEALSLREIFGCALMLAASMLAQLKHNSEKEAL